jgi:hypothetical protein
MNISKFLQKSNAVFEEKIINDILQILHEIATPVASLRLGIDEFKDQVTNDVKTDNAIDNNLRKISLSLSNDILFIQNYFAKFGDCAKYVYDSKKKLINTDALISCSAVNSFKKAQCEFICRTQLERDIVESCYWDGDDIIFQGEADVMTLVFYFLIKNAISNIKQCGSGSILLRSEVVANDQQVLHFIDTGKVLKTGSLRFDNLEILASFLRSDLAFGMYFVHKFLFSLGGMIKYNSGDGKKNEFILVF